MKERIPTEHDECVALASYLQLLVNQGKIREYGHLVNELKLNRRKGQRPNFAYLNSRKAEGWRPGVPDYLIVTENDILFIEMKRSKGGVLSEHQERWIEAIREAGGKVFVCEGFEEAKEVIEREIAR